VLVLVGAMMMGESDNIDWRNMLVAVPAFMTIVVQPFTFSIANGIYAGLLMSALVYLLTGTFIDVGREWLAMLRGEGSAGAAEAAGEAPDALDGAEAGGEGKEEGGGEGVDAPLLGGGGAGAAAAATGIPRIASLTAGSGADLESLPGSLRTSDAISITHRRGSREMAAGSLSRSHPYERGSFGMLVRRRGWGGFGVRGSVGHTFCGSCLELPCTLHHALPPRSPPPAPPRPPDQHARLPHGVAPGVGAARRAACRLHGLAAAPRRPPGRAPRHRAGDGRALIPPLTPAAARRPRASLAPFACGPRAAAQLHTYAPRVSAST
jgi:hypothetical protein